MFYECLLGSGSLVKLFCDEHRNITPVSSHATGNINVTFTYSVQFSVSVELDV